MATRALDRPVAYDDDFAGWAFDQARRLRDGRLGDLDIANIAEELETLGRGEYRQLVSELVIVLHHLLEWRYQPERRGPSWEGSIAEHRKRVRRTLRDNPSLKPRWSEAVTDAYDEALSRTARVLRRPESSFPPECPFSREDILDRAPQDLG